MIGEVYKGSFLKFGSGIRTTWHVIYALMKIFHSFPLSGLFWLQTSKLFSGLQIKEHLVSLTLWFNHRKKFSFKFTSQIRFSFENPARNKGTARFYYRDKWSLLSDFAIYVDSSINVGFQSIFVILRRTRKGWKHKSHGTVPLNELFSPQGCWPFKWIIHYRLLSMRMPKTSSFSVRDILDLPRTEEPPDPISPTAVVASTTTTATTYVTSPVSSAASSSILSSSFHMPTSLQQQQHHHNRHQLYLAQWPMVSPLFSQNNCKSVIFHPYV